MVDEEPVELAAAYTGWRQKFGPDGWGLTWYLAAELCDRFYALHGIAPTVIQHDGIGYYGIELVQLPCHGSHQSLGRFTASGDVENWVTGSPGDHGLKLTERIAPTAHDLIREAIAFLHLAPNPSRAHATCRHKRWGASYQLIFRIVALLALRWDRGVQIRNDRDLVRAVADLDPHVSMREHAGYFLIDVAGRQLIITGDGRMLSPAGQSLWDRYMSGESIGALLRSIEAALNLS